MRAINRAVWLRLCVTLSIVGAGACGDDGGSPDVDAGADAARSGTCSGSDAPSCDNGDFCDGVEVCDPTHAQSDPITGCAPGTPIDCDDGVACTADRCDETIDRCAHIAPDADDDGHRSATCLDAQGEALGDDCDDQDAARNPAMLERCDSEGVDEDCDPRTFGTVDNDGDESIDAACFNTDTQGLRVGGLDCDDDNLAVHGRQVELCDGIDNDCDEAIDEQPYEVAWYLDSDGDGFGAGDDVVLSCNVQSGRSILGTDCNDMAASVHPAASETCDGTDNNCNGAIDEGLIDCETTGEPPTPIVNACLNGLDDCNEYATCTDNAEGFTCACNAGFSGTGHGSGGCRDINECAGGSVLACGVGATSCLNGLGSFACFCGAGFEGTGAQACVDIDECAFDNGGCDVERACVNAAPGRTCGACGAGYVAVGSTACAPVLTSLTPSRGRLSPTLNPLETSYTLRVGVADTSVTLSPVARPGVTITINGQLVASGAAWSSPMLDQTSLTIGIVLSEPERPSRYYTIAIERPLSPTYVKSSHPDIDDAFGQYVSLSADGNTLAVSVGEEDSNATTINGDASNNSAASAGAVFVYARTGNAWVQQAYIKASNAEANDRFGRSVVLSGDGNTLAVNGYFEDSNAGGINGDQTNNAAGDSGAVYVFTRSGNAWTQQAYLKSDTPRGAHLFGAALSLSHDGNVLLAGAPQDDSLAVGVSATYQQPSTGNETGGAYVFERAGNTWQQLAYLKASNPDSLDYFGNRVAVAGDGNTLAVSALGEASAATTINGNQGSNTATRAGAVYVFARSGNTWAQQAYVKASNAEANDNFGSGIDFSFDGNRMLVGAFQESSNATGIGGAQGNNSAANAGAAYLFQRSGLLWSQSQYIKASNTETTDNFGNQVSLSDDGTRMAIGASVEDGATTGVNGNAGSNSAPSSGAVYVFAESDGTWSQVAYVKASNTATDDRFGSAVALSGDGLTLAVGAPQEDGSATGIDGDQSSNATTNSGAVYVY